MKILYRFLIFVFMVTAFLIFLVPYSRAFVLFAIIPGILFCLNHILFIIVGCYITVLTIFFTANLIYNLIIEYENETHYHSTSRKFLYVSSNNLLYVVMCLYSNGKEAVDTLFVLEIIFVFCTFLLYPLHKYLVKKQNEVGFEDDTDNDVKAVKVFHLILIILPIMVSAILGVIIILR